MEGWRLKGHEVRTGQQAQVYIPLSVGTQLQYTAVPPQAVAFAKDGGLIVVWPDHLGPNGVHRRLLFWQVR